jgi:hypothetical protein
MATSVFALSFLGAISWWHLNLEAIIYQCFKSEIGAQEHESPMAGFSERQPVGTTPPSNPPEVMAYKASTG